MGKYTTREMEQLNIRFRDKDEKEFREYQEHCDYNLYSNCYTEALRCIFMRALREEADDQRKNKEWYQKDVSNIISFMGKRGSGKTTAMNEFRRILEKINDKKEFEWWLSQCMPDAEQRKALKELSFEFKVMEPIDASRLEAKEDLFELILAGLYREYEKQRKSEQSNLGRFNSYECRQELEQFGKIFRSYHALRINSKEDEFTDSIIAKFQYMSSSMEIKQNIENLTQLLLNQRNGRRDEKQYLVLVIDDLDINVKNGYDMLAQLHKYFWNRHIIIVLAVDYEQINIISETGFWTGLHASMGNCTDMFVSQKHVLQQAKKISDDYMTKVLPLDNRIFMPDIRRMEQKIEIEDESGQWVSAKEFLMRKIASVMRIYYDACSANKHYCEPDTVRELVNYKQFLDALYITSFETVSDTVDDLNSLMYAYDRNQARYLWDISGRLARQLLDDEYKIIYEEILKRDLGRRAYYIVDMFQPRIMHGEALEIPKGYDKSKYSYGDFLKSLYSLGKISDNDKALVKCLLASFTTEMVREYTSYRYNRQELKARSLKILKRFLGKSFGNDWLGDIVLRKIDSKERVDISQYIKVGYAYMASLNRIQLKFSFDSLVLHVNSRKSTILKNIEKWMESEKLIPTLECIAMFFESIDTNQGGEEWIDFRMDVGSEGSQQDVDKPTWFVSGTHARGILDVMGIVHKTLEYEKYTQYMYGMLTNALTNKLTDELKKKGIAIENLKEELSKIIKKQSVHTVLNWEFKGEVAFPFYDVDIAYNTIRRARQEAISIDSANVSYENCYTYIEHAYRTLGAKLEEQKAVYSDGYYRYADIFFSCPFVKAFLECDKYLNPNYKDMLGITIKNVTRPVSITTKIEPEPET